jgi:hypothetical protein
LQDLGAIKAVGESEAQFLVKVELEAENIVGSYGPWEHDVCVKSLPNDGLLNQVFDKTSTVYAVRIWAKFTMDCSKFNRNAKVVYKDDM